MGSAEIGPCCGPLAEYLSKIIPQEGDVKLLEIGAGCGAPGIWIWKKRHPQVDVVLTDVHRLVPLLQLNCEGNFAVDKMATKQLRWGVSADIAALKEEGFEFDVVVGADACYNEEKSYPLMETLVGLNPRQGVILAQSVHPEFKVEGENAIDAIMERAGEAGWHCERTEIQTGCSFRGQEYLCAILTLTPPQSQTSSRKSRHSKFDPNFHLE